MHLEPHAVDRHATRLYRRHFGEDRIGLRAGYLICLLVQEQLRRRVCREDRTLMFYGDTAAGGVCLGL